MSGSTGGARRVGFPGLCDGAQLGKGDAAVAIGVQHGETRHALDFVFIDGNAAVIVAVEPGKAAEPGPVVAEFEGAQLLVSVRVHARKTLIACIVQFIWDNSTVAVPIEGGEPGRYVVGLDRRSQYDHGERENVLHNGGPPV